MTFLLVVLAGLTLFLAVAALVEALWPDDVLDIERDGDDLVIRRADRPPAGRGW